MSNLFPEGVREFLASYPYKIELHAHTSPVSSCSELSPKEIVFRLHEKGYHAVAITNHFHAGGPYMREKDPVGAYLADYYAAKEAGDKLGMQVYLGAEFRFLENRNEYLVYGTDEPFLRETVHQFDWTYMQFYDAYHCEKRLILQAHPFRDDVVPMPAAYMDGMETFNMHPHHNSRIVLAAIYGAENRIPVVTVGTDLHHPEHVGICALRTKCLPSSGEDLVKLLRGQDYLFEIGGYPVLPYGKFEP